MFVPCSFGAGGACYPLSAVGVGNPVSLVPGCPVQAPAWSRADLGRVVARGDGVWTQPRAALAQGCGDSGSSGTAGLSSRGQGLALPPPAVASRAEQAQIGRGHV